MVPKIKIYNTLSCTIYNDYDNCTMTADAYADKLFEALEEDDTDLAPYADCEEFSNKLLHTRITLEWVNGLLYGLCICRVSDDRTAKDTEQLKKYLSGQYSDGWGKGFEQHPILSFTETETGEYYENKWEVRTQICVSFRQSHGYKIMTEEEINV